MEGQFTLNIDSLQVDLLNDGDYKLRLGYLEKSPGLRRFQDEKNIIDFKMFDEDKPITQFVESCQVEFTLALKGYDYWIAHRDEISKDMSGRRKIKKGQIYDIGQRVNDVLPIDESLESDHDFARTSESQKLIGISNERPADVFLYRRAKGGSKKNDEKLLDDEKEEFTTDDPTDDKDAPEKPWKRLLSLTTGFGTVIPDKDPVKAHIIVWFEAIYPSKSIDLSIPVRHQSRIIDVDLSQFKDGDIIEVTYTYSGKFEKSGRSAPVKSNDVAASDLPNREDDAELANPGKKRRHRAHVANGAVSN